jgi:hypothetical protein
MGEVPREEMFPNFPGIQEWLELGLGTERHRD